MANSQGATLRLTLDDTKPLYLLPADNLAEEVLIPGFAQSTAASCMVGFFTSGVLADLAPGLATYIQNATANFRLIVSPFISAQDQQALEAGLTNASDLAADFINNALITVEDLQRHTLRCLSYLLAVGRIEIRIALMKEALFHPKVWVFETPSGALAVHGSSNMTRFGIRRNYEQITVSKSWVDATQRYITEKLADRFERLWKGHDDDCIVLELPDAVKEKILRDYPCDRAPTEDDFRELYKRATRQTEASSTQEIDRIDLTRPTFTIPSSLKFEDGPFSHQGEAIHAWVNAGFRGILEMATGSGKTVTSMIAAYRLYERHKPLFIVVAAPYVPLIEQWCDEIALFGLKPINLTRVGNASDRSRALQQIGRRLRLGLSDVEIVVVSHDTLCSSEFMNDVSELAAVRLLIGDEVHNLGRESFVANPPAFFEHRLALSATPVRQYDPDGTDAVFDFFGEVVYKFSLRDAIGRCLVEYDYYLHPVALTEMEMDLWKEITARIRQNAWRQTDNQPDEYLAKLFRDRRLLLETAEDKIETLSRLLDQENLNTLRHTLIYASDKEPRQLDAVNSLLNRKGVLFHQLTAEETADRRQTRQIIEAFQGGDIQVLTAKRVLDEGVNIPQISKAFILASTTVERQWIQRRGRLLRTCKETGKTHSVINDLLASSASLDTTIDGDARALIRSELRRAQEFASLARNAGKADGPLPLIHKLVKAAFL